MKVRALASLTMLFSFILLPLTGIPLHIYSSLSEQDTVRHALMSIHNTTSIIFIIALIIHLVFNWKAIMNYMLTKSKEYMKFKKEMIVALIIVLGIVGLFTSHVFHIRKDHINHEKYYDN